MKELQLVLRNQPPDRGTEKQKAQRERFAAASREASEHFKNTRLKGADKVQAMNARIKENMILRIQ